MSLDRIVETAGLKLVAVLDDGSGYDWREMNVYYSPSARRFFWYADSGCSCNQYGDGVYSIEDFENGSREDALREVSAFVGPQHDDYNRAVMFIKAVRVER